MNITIVKDNNFGNYRGTYNRWSAKPFGVIMPDGSVLRNKKGIARRFGSKAAAEKAARSALVV